MENPELFKKDGPCLRKVRSLILLVALLFCENGGRATTFFVRTYVDGKQTMVVQWEVEGSTNNTYLSATNHILINQVAIQLAMCGKSGFWLRTSRFARYPAEVQKRIAQEGNLVPGSSKKREDAEIMDPRRISYSKRCGFDTGH